MDWKIMATTFGAIFLAELGDKTQLATMGMASGATSKWAVFIGASLALIATSALGVLLGDGLSRVIPPHWIQRGAGLLFVGIGIFMLWPRVGEG
jgi:putative Ca2+/H+ antiporter (TMEM165/GDT1 family)